MATDSCCVYFVNGMYFDYKPVEVRSKEDSGIYNNIVFDFFDEIPMATRGEAEIESLAGYIVIKDSTLYFDEVEIIEPEDKERIKELGLDEDLTPTGFEILNEIQKKIKYELTDETVYNFLDVYRFFIEDEIEDRAYTTIKKDEFLKHLGEYNQNDIPLFEQTIEEGTEMEI